MSQHTSKLEQAPRKPKRAWVTPRLIEHGSLKEITAKLGTTPDVSFGGSFNS
jgi:hypothetical protein